MQNALSNQEKNAMLKYILSSAEESVKAIQKIQSKKGVDFIESTSKLIIACYKAGGKLLLAGNGGSLCDAMHFAEELTGYYRKKRPALPAIALADPGHITCVANDAGFDQVFSRGVEALGKKEDIFIGLTTSGNSENLLKAFQKATSMGLSTVAFLGKSGGIIQGKCDLEWLVDGFLFSDRIQEAHMAAIHIIIEMVEKELFYSPSRKEEMVGVS